jgi:5'-3' exonuclease
MENNLILVDSSFLSFYRFFATLRWMSLAHKDEYKLYKDDINYDWSKNKIFIDKYEKMYLDSIIKIIGKKDFKNSKIIFARDAPQKTLWRSKITDDYKGERQDLTLKNNFKPTFEYTYNIIIPKLVDNKNIFVMYFDNMEADDIIAITTNYYKNKNIFNKIFIVSGDEDFLQLGDEKVYFANFKKKKVFQLSKEEANENLKKKLICGDNSDNIKCILDKKIKNKKKLVDDLKVNEKELELYLDQNIEAKEKFKHNQKMIDFNYIPKKYVNLVEKYIKTLKF